VGHDHENDGNHHHEHSHTDGKVGPSAKTGIDNWRRSELPFSEKLRLSMRNTFTKLRNRSSCCGHPGEPGC
jgi:hypothetical protein